jgi:flavodoxin
MNVSQVYAVYFSATGNTRKVTTTLANALAVSFDVPLEVRDFTLPAAREEAYEFAEGDLVIFGMPTYAGKLPNKLLDFVKSGFRGNGALAVPVVTFGNRSFDNSLAELCAVLCQHGKAEQVLDENRAVFKLDVVSRDENNLIA